VPLRATDIVIRSSFRVDVCQRVAPRNDAAFNVASVDYQWFHQRSTVNRP
jgi:hypothetical protein